MVTAAVLSFTLPAGAGHRAIYGKARFISGKLAGNTMACGGTYQPYKMVAAHRKLPCGKRVRVKNLRNGKRVVVRIADRGPYGDPEVVIDVSRRAAKDLGFFRRGITKVKVTPLH